jgi:hypothetical protein
LFSGDGKMESSVAVCYDQEYMKLWDCQLGCFKKSYDFSRYFFCDFF